PQALGKAQTNKPRPRNSQNSLASRQGLSNDSMRGRKESGASKDRQPTPISKPSRTVPATIIKKNRARNASGIQNAGSWAPRPNAFAKESIMPAPDVARSVPHQNERHVATSGKNQSCTRCRPGRNSANPAR